jgi:hypothetical protein
LTLRTTWGSIRQALKTPVARDPDSLPCENALSLRGDQDRGGSIIHLRYIGGTAIQTNGKTLIPSNECREIAKWEQALEELTSKGFVVDRGYKGEVFEITHLGYQVADMMAL